MSVLNKFILVVISTLVGSIFFNSCNNKDPKSARTQMVETSIKVSTCKTKEASETKYLKTTINKTVFKCNELGIDTSLAFLNGAISKTIAGSIEAMNKNIEEYKDDYEEMKQTFPYEIYYSDTVYCYSENYVSLLSSIYSFSGGAHGMTTNISFNYDIPHKKLLTKNDLLKKVDLFKLSSLLQKYYLKEGGKADDLFEMPTIEKVSHICFDKDHIIFIFDQYVIACYAYGSIFISVPLYEVRPFLKIDL